MARDRPSGPGVTTAGRSGSAVKQPVDDVEFRARQPAGIADAAARHPARVVDAPARVVDAAVQVEDGVRRPREYDAEPLEGVGPEGGGVADGPGMEICVAVDTDGFHARLKVGPAHGLLVRRPGHGRSVLRAGGPRICAGKPPGDPRRAGTRAANGRRSPARPVLVGRGPDERDPVGWGQTGRDPARRTDRQRPRTDCRIRRYDVSHTWAGISPPRSSSGRPPWGYRPPRPRDGAGPCPGRDGDT